MKKVLLGIALSLLLMPICVFASVKEINKEDYVSTNLKEVLNEETIEPLFSNYEENDKQITIYLFRGKGCAYCKAFLNYLNSITEEYGKYFKVESYEVWMDGKNADLLDTVSEFLEQPAQGVPYIVIGDKVFPGYAEQYNDGIKNAIIELYESEDKYDVFEEMNEAIKIENRKAYMQIIITISCNFIFITISTILILLIIDKKDKRLNKRLYELEMAIKENNKEITKESKKAHKKNESK